MTDDNKNDTQNITEEQTASSETTFRTSVGTPLRDAREAAGLTVEQIADQLHLRPTLIKEIEADNFSNIASTTYAKGYIRNYARFLSIDEDSLIASLSQHIPEEEAPAMQSFSKKRTEKAHDSRFSAITWLFVIVVIGMLVFWWVQKTEAPAGIDFSEPSIEEQAAAKEMPVAESLAQVEQAVNTPELAVTPEAPVATATELPAQSQSQPTTITPTETAISSSSTTANPVENIAQAIEQEIQSAPASRPVFSEPAPVEAVVVKPAPKLDSLSLTFQGDCWLKVQDANGKVLLEGIKSTGTENLSGDAPFKVTLGAPQMVSMTFNGQSVDMSAYPTGKVARITLP